MIPDFRLENKNISVEKCIRVTPPSYRLDRHKQLVPFYAISVESSLDLYEPCCEYHVLLHKLCCRYQILSYVPCVKSMYLDMLFVSFTHIGIHA